MAASGLGDAQHRNRDGFSGGKVTFNKQSRRQGGLSQAGKKNTVTGVKSVHSKSGQKPGSGKVKRRWRPSQQVFAGSAKEGKGFALWRKQKVQLEYKKLQRKQKKTAAAKALYEDSYPEHLKHLYLAEEERLKNLERKRKPEDDPTQTTEEEDEEVVVPKNKFKKKTSNQKAKEEYEQVQRERAKKKKEAEETRRKREEAKELYKKKKMEAYKVLSTKTKKGQPNFNVQMEYLLKKIQSKT